jgi:hypothetical protein
MIVATRQRVVRGITKFTGPSGNFSIGAAHQQKKPQPDDRDFFADF